MSEPREIQVVALFPSRFGGFGGVTDFRPAAIAATDDDEMTEDGQGNPAPPRATNLPEHPSQTVRVAPAPVETPTTEPILADPGPDPASSAPQEPEFSLDDDAAAVAALLAPGPDAA